MQASRELKQKLYELEEVIEREGGHVGLYETLLLAVGVSQRLRHQLLLESSERDLLESNLHLLLQMMRHAEYREGHK